MYEKREILALNRYIQILPTAKAKTHLLFLSPNKLSHKRRMEEEEGDQNPTRIPMERAARILRRSIFIFFKNYQYFTLISSLIALPFSASLLISQSLTPFSPLLPRIHNTLKSLFDASNLPPSSLELFSLLNFKLSQTITASVLALPFTLSFLLLAKSTIFNHLNHPTTTTHLSLPPSFLPILHTYLFNSILILSVNATCFAIFILGVSFLEGFGLSSSPTILLFLSASWAVLYSIILANAYIIGNLALVSSALDKHGGYFAILKTCVLIRGRAATALALVLPFNMAMAGVESLFQYRVVRGYYLSSGDYFSLALEGVFIAYMYSILVVIDAVVSFVFFRSCRNANLCQIRIAMGNGKCMEELP